MAVPFDSAPQAPLRTPALEETLARGRAGDISLDEVLAVLADTDLYLPIDDGARFRARETDDGRTFVPAFATVDELRKAEPATPYRVATGRDLADGWDGSLWMYVNPDGRTPLMLRADKVSALAAVPVPPAEESTPDASGVMVSVQAPRTPVPEALTAAVRGVLARDDVSEAYVFEAQDDAHGVRLVAGLVPTPGLSVRDLAAAVATVYRGARGLSVEVMAIDTALRDVVASSVSPCG